MLTIIYKFGVLLAGSKAQQLLILECGFLGLSSWALQTASTCLRRKRLVLADGKRAGMEQVWPDADRLLLATVC